MYGVVVPIDTESPHLSTRELILHEALQCFADTGYEGTSLNDIAAAVGIRRPSLLHHFESKEALYGEAFERLLSDWMERLDLAIASEARGWEKFEVVLSAGFQLFEDNPNYVRLMRREALDGGGHLGIDLSAVLRPMFDAAADYLERQMEEGAFRQFDARHLLLSAYGSILSYFSDAPFIDGLIDDEALSKDSIREHKEHVLRFFRAALLP
ncbi:MAG: hypothetical protein RLZ84_935 [Actinomycetota bacterium]